MKNEKGITLLALVITLTILAIIGFTVFYTAEGLDEGVEDDVLIAELQTVHHIVLQEYNKELTLGDYDFVGNKIENIADFNTKLGNKLSSSNTYYKLDKNDLESIGVKNANSEYLVCYETGEVANIIEYKTSDGEPLYTK